MQAFYLYTTMFVLIGSVVIQAAQKRFMLEMYDVSCQNFTKNVKHFKCDFKKVGNGMFLLNSYFMYDRKIGKDFDIHACIRVTPWNGKVSYNFLDIKKNLCSVVSQDLNNNLLRKLLHELIRASNIQLDCPVKANFMYKLANYSVTDEFIPVYAPFMNATFSLELLQKSKVMASLVASSEIIPKK